MLPAQSPIQLEITQKGPYVYTLRAALVKLDRIVVVDMTKKAKIEFHNQDRMLKGNKPEMVCLRSLHHIDTMDINSDK